MGERTGLVLDAGCNTPELCDVKRLYVLLSYITTNMHLFVEIINVNIIKNIK